MNWAVRSRISIKNQYIPFAFDTNFNTVAAQQTEMNLCQMLRNSSSSVPLAIFSNYSQSGWVKANRWDWILSIWIHDINGRISIECSSIHLLLWFHFFQWIFHFCLRQKQRCQGQPIHRHDFHLKKSFFMLQDSIEKVKVIFDSFFFWAQECWHSAFWPSSNINLDYKSLSKVEHSTESTEVWN